MNIENTIKKSLKELGIFHKEYGAYLEITKQAVGKRFKRVATKEEVAGFKDFLNQRMTIPDLGGFTVEEICEGLKRLGKAGIKINTNKPKKP